MKKNSYVLFFLILLSLVTNSAEFVETSLSGIFVRHVNGSYHAYRIEDDCEKSPCKVTFQSYELRPTPHMACDWGEGFSEIKILEKSKGKISVDRSETEDRFKCALDLEVIKSNSLKVVASECEIITSGCEKEAMTGTFNRLAEPSFKCAEDYFSGPLDKLIDLNTIEFALCTDHELAELDTKISELFKSMSSSKKKVIGQPSAANYLVFFIKFGFTPVNKARRASIGCSPCFLQVDR